MSDAATGTPRPAVAAQHPWVYGVLYFPMGLMLGYPSVALGYLGSRAGLPISSIATIVGMSFLRTWVQVHLGAARRLHARASAGG